MSIKYNKLYSKYFKVSNLKIKNNVYKIIIRFDDICPTMNWDIFLYIKENFN